MSGGGRIADGAREAVAAARGEIGATAKVTHSLVRRVGTTDDGKPVYEAVLRFVAFAPCDEARPFGETPGPCQDDQG